MSMNSFLRGLQQYNIEGNTTFLQDRSSLAIKYSLERDSPRDLPLLTIVTSHYL